VHRRSCYASLQRKGAHDTWRAWALLSTLPDAFLLSRLSVVGGAERGQAEG
jgi:hypothetical protein